MVLDPMSALAVAASAVQFVDFARKIVCKSKDLYRSADGVLEENKQTETVTMRLKELADHVLDPSTPLPSNYGDIFSNTQLRAICMECGAISEKLLRRLHQLKVPENSKHRQWKSFRQALKSTWSTKEVNDLASRLSYLRAELDTEVLLLLRDSFSSMSIKTKGQLESLDNKTQTVMDELLNSNSTRQDFCKRLDLIDSSQRSIFEELGFENIQRDIQFKLLDSNTKRIIELLVERRTSHDGEVAEARLLLQEARESAAKLVARDNLKRADRARKVKLSILESFRFPDITHRPESISSPHEATFHWIFRDSEKYQKPWDNFSSWVSRGSGIYWIQGKPASGKSTLMHFIVNHTSTPRLLKGWSGHAELLHGAFYFWNSGSPDQRSHAGLLRTLLYEVLSKREDLILEIFREEWERKRDSDLDTLGIVLDNWSLGRLQRALKDIINLANESLKMCFFIDGLDEYEGEPGDIADYVSELAEISPHAKFCVSGRPLPVFQSVFLEVSGLRLEDLTRDDIKNYVTHKLGSERHMRKLLQMNPRDGNWLITEIVQRASGVFLWVILVVKSLIHGFRSGDRIQDLRKRLEALPADLETLFGHILERIEPEYQEESSKIFQIFRASNHVLDLFTLYCALLYPDYQRVLDMLVVDSGETTIWFETESVKLRLGSRCRGLLETSLGNESSYNTMESASAQSPEFQEADPVNLYQLRMEDISTARQEFVNGHMQAKNHLRYGDSGIMTVDINRRREKEDFLYFNAVWLMREHGGPLRDWISIARENDKPAFLNNFFARWNVYTPELVENDSEDAPNSAESQNVFSTIPDSQEIEMAAEKEDDSPRIVEVYWISYMHRTARDFIEQPRNWNRITLPTSKSGFDPHVAILMASLIKLKTELIEDVYETGATFLKMVKDFKLAKSTPLIQLIEEYDRVLNIRSKAQGREGHWSLGDPEWKGISADWGIDLDTIAIQFDATWIVTARQAENASPCYHARQADLPLPFFNTITRPGLPLIGYTISYHKWELGEQEKVLSHPPINFQALKELLEYGSDPNECFRGHTIWEYTLCQVHTHKDVLYQMSMLESWLEIFKVMLLHGADPYACCVQDSSEFNRGIGLVGEPSADSETRTREHLQPDSRTKRGFDPNAWDKEDIHPYHHSVTAIVEDVFRRYKCPGTEELKRILEEKKKQSTRSKRRRETNSDRREDFKRQNWVS